MGSLSAVDSKLTVREMINASKKTNDTFGIEGTSTLAYYLTLPLGYKIPTNYAIYNKVPIAKIYGRK